MQGIKDRGGGMHVGSGVQLMCLCPDLYIVSFLPVYVVIMSKCEELSLKNKAKILQAVSVGTKKKIWNTAEITVDNSEGEGFHRQCSQERHECPTEVNEASNIRRM